MAEELTEAVDAIMGIPADYFAIAFAITAVFAFIATILRTYPRYYEAYKDKARSEGAAIAYGIDYLERNILAVIVGIIAGLAVLGWMVSQGMIAVDEGSDVYIPAVIIGFIAGFAGDWILGRFQEARRDKAKGDDAIKSAQPAESAPASDSEVVVIKKRSRTPET